MVFDARPTRIIVPLALICLLQCSCLFQPDLGRGVGIWNRMAPDVARIWRSTSYPSGRNELSLYLDAPLSDRKLRANYTGAKFEPIYGCYVGAYVESDELLDSIHGPDGAPMRREEAFGVCVGKHLATAFTYCAYGRPFPLTWARALTAAGIAPHIAFEPNNGLKVVQDGAYLQHFAHDAASVGGPVFIRWASEMNGDWTAYSGNPRLYREKWRLVHGVFARDAPNIAMMWCVFTTPQRNWDAYYPGDAYVDWAGINIYSVLHHDNNPERPAAHESPSRMLRAFYQKFARRKPIAICEFGATHREELNQTEDGSDFAVRKIRDMYLSLPRLYPRVKLIDVFDLNCLAHAPEGRRLNDYCVTNHPAVLQAFRQCISSSYFLSRVVDAGPGRGRLTLGATPLHSGVVLNPLSTIMVAANTQRSDARVICSVDGSPVGRCAAPGVFHLQLDSRSYLPGSHRLTARLQDKDGLVLAQIDRDVVFPGNNGSAVAAIGDPAPRMGEIQVEGAVTNVNARAREVVIAVTRIRYPGGKTLLLNRVRPKTVALRPDALVSAGPGSNRSLDLTSLRTGITVVATGMDLGAGELLPARAVGCVGVPDARGL